MEDLSITFISSDFEEGNDTGENSCFVRKAENENDDNDLTPVEAKTCIVDIEHVFATLAFSQGRCINKPFSHKCGTIRFG